MKSKKEFDFNVKVISPDVEYPCWFVEVKDIHCSKDAHLVVGVSCGDKGKKKTFVLSKFINAKNYDFAEIFASKKLVMDILEKYRSNGDKGVIKCLNSICQK